MCVRLLTIADVQEACKVSRSKAYKMLEEGLAYIQLGGPGGAIRVRESALMEFLENREEKSKSA